MLHIITRTMWINMDVLRAESILAQHAEDRAAELGIRKPAVELTQLFSIPMIALRLSYSFDSI